VLAVIGLRGKLKLPSRAAHPKPIHSLEKLLMSMRVPLIAAGFLFVSSALAADWPEFRGPNRDGICTETGLLQEWPKNGPPKVWTATNLGLGYGTPSVAAGKIFGLGTRDGKDGVWALKEGDGSELWFTPFDAPRKISNNNGPSGTPTFHDGKLYAVSSNGKLVCLDAAKGTVLWQDDYLKDFGGKVPGWGYTESVFVDGQKVICTPGGTDATVVALNKDTGKPIWKSPLGQVGGGQGYCSPVKATVNGITMYVVLLGNTGGLVGVNADNGKELWRYNKTAFGGVAQIPMPIIKGDLVWFSTSYPNGGSGLLQLIPKGKDKFDVKELKTYKKDDLSNHHGGMVLVGDYIYFGHDQNQGYPVCVEFKTGEIKWGPDKNASHYGGGKGSAAVLFADNRLYFRYQNRKLVLIEPSPDGLKVVSSFELPEPNVKDKPESWPHPVIANGKMYIRDQDKLYCFNVKADKN
jgi:outer membrane protein assembly factor BamB